MAVSPVGDTPELPLLRTKLSVPPLRRELVSRRRLLTQLSEGLWRDRQRGRKLTLVSAPAGFGKTTLVASWLATARGIDPSTTVAWLSLDEGDNDGKRFLTYVIAAMRMAISEASAPSAPRDGWIAFGRRASAALRLPQSPPLDVVLSGVINELMMLDLRCVLVLDDYHLIESQSVHDALAFLLQHLPAQLHLVIATRVDPPLPVARLRARGQLTEIRAADLRFTSSEATEFLNDLGGLQLLQDDVAALEHKTEGWIAGLQLASLALQGSLSASRRDDAARFIESFTGSHRYVLDFLLEEVLNRQPAIIQDFLLRTAILDRFTASLCDAVLLGTTQPPIQSQGATVGLGRLEAPQSSPHQVRQAMTAEANGSMATGSVPSQEILAYLERANLFIVPLDSERGWYRYHHLFADLLRQQLRRRVAATPDDPDWDVDRLHRRASAWYEAQDLIIEAFRHAASAHDLERAERLAEGGGVPLYYRGALVPVRDWLGSLSNDTLNARPALWVMYASALLFVGRVTEAEMKLQAAEAALDGRDLDTQTRDLIGRVANLRANIAMGHGDLDAILVQSQRALAYLDPENVTDRTATTYHLGVAYELRGERQSAREAFQSAVAISLSSGNVYTQILATVGLGGMEHADTRLKAAADLYRQALELVGDRPIPIGPYVQFCLASIAYEWNDLASAADHVRRSLELGEPYGRHYSIVAACLILTARLWLAQGDEIEAMARLDQAEVLVRRHDFADQRPPLTAARVLILLRKGRIAEAADLARADDLPLTRARVHLAQQEPAEAVTLLATRREAADAKGWRDQQLEVRVLLAMAHDASGDRAQARRRLDEALALAEPGGFVRTFVDEGAPMADLLKDARARGMAPDYVDRLLSAFHDEPTMAVPTSPRDFAHDALLEPLSDRELEVLRLIADGLTNREVAGKLYLTVNTVKAHTRNIYGKLGVHSRTAAARRASDLGLL